MTHKYAKPEDAERTLAALAKQRRSAEATLSRRQLIDFAAQVAFTYVADSPEAAAAYYARIGPEEAGAEALEALAWQTLYGANGSDASRAASETLAWADDYNWADELTEDHRKRRQLRAPIYGEWGLPNGFGVPDMTLPPEAGDRAWARLHVWGNDIGVLLTVRESGQQTAVVVAWPAWRELVAEIDQQRRRMVAHPRGHAEASGAQDR